MDKGANGRHKYSGEAYSADGALPQQYKDAYNRAPAEYKDAYNRAPAVSGQVGRGAHQNKIGCIIWATTN